MKEEPITATRQERAIRVFISSTFRDMKEEREELVKHVLPRLRGLCETRGVTWGEVDLRWGITDEQKAEGMVLPILFEEINGCKPYFIGMLGECYGWVPPEIPGELIVQEPWLAEQSGKSVTELEILHGALNDPDRAKHTFFYFRDPAYVESMPVQKQEDFLELPNSEDSERFGLKEAERRAKERRDKLSGLKERIRMSGLPVRERYLDPKEFGDLVFRDIKRLVDDLFPEGVQLDPLDREAAEHESFIQSRFKTYIGRKEYYERLDRHALSEGPPLVVLGESGSGKSALLANWAARHREMHADEFMIAHFVGATSYSADWAAMLRRIMGEFKRRFDIREDIPADGGKLIQTFANWLYLAGRKGRVVLILDGLNQLEDRDNALNLAWLPPVIPENIRLVLSTLPGRPLDEINRRGWPSMQVKPLYKKERRELILEYLAEHSKSLSGKQVERIVGAEQTHSPLYLRALLDELRVYGRHELLDERIKHYLGAEDVPALYKKIFERYEGDYEDYRPGMVSGALTLVWAARRGLSEAEILWMLGKDGKPLPRGYFSPFYLAAGKIFIIRSGLIGFTHDHIRQAVKARYMPSEADEKAGHRRLADYFATLTLTPRVVDELPWQLAEAGEWQRLVDLLSNPEFMVEAWEKDRFEVLRHWAQVEHSSTVRIIDAYQHLMNDVSQASDVRILSSMSIFLLTTGHTEQALALERRLAEIHRETGDLEQLAVSLGNQSAILRDMGDLGKAESLAGEAERISRELGDMQGLARAFHHRTLILWKLGKLDDAIALHKEEERICRELGDIGGLLKSLGNRAVIVMQRGGLDEAMALFKELEKEAREMGDPNILQAALGNQGLILSDRGDWDRATALYEEKERICRELGNRLGLASALGNHGVILEDRGDLDGAMALHKEEEAIYRQLNRPEGLLRCLGNQGMVQWKQGNPEEGIALLKEVERMCRELGNPDGLWASLVGQGGILKDMGDLDGALAVAGEAERICREQGYPDGLVRSLVLQGEILADRGRATDGLSLVQEALGVAQEHGYVPLAQEAEAAMEKLRKRT